VIEYERGGSWWSECSSSTDPPVILPEAADRLRLKAQRSSVYGAR
jgi:hypothetical protein